MPAREMPCIPPAAEAVISALERAGAEAWVVGGWVRDALLGRPSHDVDVMTSARWEDSARILRDAGIAVHETGVRHGTVTAVADGVPVEVTTCRVESGYSDLRHPDEVRFVDDAAEDLARRDLTINAIAYHPERGLLDPFGGASDLASGIIRAVGSPDERMAEDALRVLRAVRFSCRMGFAIEPATKAAAIRHAPSLSMIAQERIGAELDGILATGHMGHAMRDVPEVICAAIPELAPCLGFDQRSTYHHLDVYGHIALVVDAIEPFSGGVASSRLRWAALMHDIGKPQRFTLDDEGHGHFYGHPEESADIAERIMRRMALPLSMIRPCLALVRLHDYPIKPDDADDRISERRVRRMLAKLEGLSGGEGPALAHELAVLKQADALAHAAPYMGWASQLEGVRQSVRSVFAEQGALSISSLAIGGAEVMDDLSATPGPAVGAVLRACLEAVIEGEVANEREALLRYVSRTEIPAT